MASPPTADDIRSWTDLSLAEFGYGTDERGTARLALAVQRSESYVNYVTARAYDDPQTDEFSMVKTTLDQAVQMRAEQLVTTLGSDNVETAADFDMISSFSAGPYSETRRDELRGGSSRPDVRPLNPWPALNDLLWMLLGLFPGETNEKVLEQFDYWRFVLSGITAPAWQTVEVGWGRGAGLDEWYGGHNVLPPLVGPLPDDTISRF